jgi:hypothetical protein
MEKDVQLTATVKMDCDTSYQDEANSGVRDCASIIYMRAHDLPRVMFTGVLLFSARVAADLGTDRIGVWMLRSLLEEKF